VRRGHDILELLPGKDIDCHKVTLGVSVLSGLGGRHLYDLTGKNTQQKSERHNLITNPLQTNNQNFNTAPSS
jgi:hypothetical protein